MERDTDMIPSSPSNSSPSSSDLDTESTGSFFPDRSTTLGTLMGVSFPDGHHHHRGPARAPSRREVGGGGGGEERQRPRPAPEERGRRRMWRRRGRSGGSWWRLCREDIAGPTSLGEFLHLERQLAGAGEATGDFLCGGGAEHETLFEDGRVLPPPATAVEERGRWRLQREGSSAPLSARLPVLLTGICSGGAG